jgi:hypothetical protein
MGCLNINMHPIYKRLGFGLLSLWMLGSSYEEEHKIAAQKDVLELALHCPSLRKYQISIECEVLTGVVMIQSHVARGSNGLHGAMPPKTELIKSDPVSARLRPYRRLEYGQSPEYSMCIAPQGPQPCPGYVSCLHVDRTQRTEIIILQEHFFGVSHNNCMLKVVLFRTVIAYKRKPALIYFYCAYTCSI